MQEKSKFEFLDSDIRIVYEEFSKTIGRVLTQIEASLANEKQMEANKKIVERELYALREIVRRVVEDVKKK